MIIFTGILFVLFSISLQSSSEFKEYTGHVLLNILGNNKSSDINTFLGKINRNDAELVEDDAMIDGLPSQIRISSNVKHAFFSKLKDWNVNFIIDSENLQQDFDEENLIPDSRISTTDFDLYHYHPIGEITDHLRHTCGKSKQPCEIISIGKSFEGRDLNVVKIGEEGEYRGVVWIDGGIHAREWISPAMALILIDKMLQKNKFTDDLLERYVFYILPNMNPDGYEYTHTHDRMWRKTRSTNPGSNCRGTDPNRNWDIHWGGVGSSNNPCSNTYHGSKAFSEKETKAVSDFLLTKKGSIVLFLSLHSKTQCWLVPYSWTYDKVPDNYEDIVYVATKASEAQKNATGLHYNIIKQGMRKRLESGESFDWAKAKADATYSYILELRFKNKYGFKLPARYIEPTALETFAAFKALFKAIEELER